MASYFCSGFRSSKKRVIKNLSSAPMACSLCGLLCWINSSTLSIMTTIWDVANLPPDPFCVRCREGLLELSASPPSTAYGSRWSSVDGALASLTFGRPSFTSLSASREPEPLLRNSVSIFSIKAFCFESRVAARIDIPCSFKTLARMSDKFSFFFGHITF